MTLKLEDMIHDSAPENKNKIRGSRLKITRTDNNGNTTEKQRKGYMIQGEEMVFLNAPEIYFPEDAPLSTEKRELCDILNELCGTPLGDGLYFFRGDLYCSYKLLSTIVNDNSVVFEYEKYTVTVSWDNDTEMSNKRINPKWERKYKQTDNVESEV